MCKYNRKLRHRGIYNDESRKLIDYDSPESIPLTLSNYYSCVCTRQSPIDQAEAHNFFFIAMFS